MMKRLLCNIHYFLCERGKTLENIKGTLSIFVWNEAYIVFRRSEDNRYFVLQETENETSECKKDMFCEVILVDEFPDYNFYETTPVDIDKYRQSPLRGKVEGEDRVAYFEYKTTK